MPVETGTPAATAMETAMTELRHRRLLLLRVTVTAMGTTTLAETTILEATETVRLLIPATAIPVGTAMETPAEMAMEMAA